MQWIFLAVIKFMATMYEEMQGIKSRYSPWGHEELDVTEQLTLEQTSAYGVRTGIFHEVPISNILSHYSHKHSDTKTWILNLHSDCEYCVTINTPGGQGHECPVH